MKTTICEISDCWIASVHYPCWDEYFARRVKVVDRDTYLEINGFYEIEKNRILACVREGDRITLRLSDRPDIVLRTV